MNESRAGKMDNNQVQKKDSTAVKHFNQFNYINPS